MQEGGSIQVVESETIQKEMTPRDQSSGTGSLSMMSYRLQVEKVNEIDGYTNKIGDQGDPYGLYEEINSVTKRVREKGGMEN